ncbi:MAG TPA: T9SS type A sorting domain-containing protein [Ferruginibacter sp.]|nr:T9SS type A sorting domain-containing protein [Ferruginibacter sp.]
MAFIRNCFVVAVCIFCALFTTAQTIHYPLRSSQLLKSTAEDVAMLLKKAIPSGQFSTQLYTALPSSGIILVYDSTITDNQLCKVESNGTNLIKFTASQDNGLHFGLYQYLQQLGFRFYQPGSIWEVIPSLPSAYKNIDTIYTSAFKYKSWLISGGHNRWIMDNNSNYGWDTYFGENGHNWALYQRRNAMAGAHGFSGHRGDIMTGSYLTTLQANPCYVAAYNNSRVANPQSVPDVNNNAAMNLWSSTIEQKYTQYRNAIFGNVNLYVNQSRNYNYSFQNIGIEVPDGSKWGNSKDNLGCGNMGYAKESDQQFTLANFTAQKINAKYPQARFQLYAYSTHADIPSAGLEINKNIDVQLVPAVYQNITSTNGLRNRWYNRTNNISEYNYFNLSGWSGETPAFYLEDFKATLQIAKDKKSQGLMWESSPAKFGSLPFLLAANSNLKDNISVDNSLQEFCDNMFEAAGKTIYALLQLWTDNKSLAGGTSNRYKVPLYLKMLTDADQQIHNAAPVVKERMRELKAYVHYMIMYYDWASDQRPAAEKAEKAAALCIYLAKTNKMQLVNSYFLIATIVSKYPATSAFFQQYNHVNGSAYQNGNLPLLTAAEIDNNFQNDKAIYGNIIKEKEYKFESGSFIKDQFNAAGINPVKKINVKLNYTNGLDYYNRSEFFIKAPAAGNFTIKYSPQFDMPDKGYINFLVESTDKALLVVEDFTIDRNAKDGTLVISLPSAGTYKLSVISKYKSGVDLDITTNKNYFYKNGAFLGTATEIYLAGQPGYFYVPKGIDKIYFSINNSNAGGNGFASAEKINNAFAIKDSDGNTLPADFVIPNDSALFYMNIPKESIGKFCKVSKLAGYGLVFSNIGNILWFAEPKPKPCANADFTVSIIKKNGSCITRLTAVSKNANLKWEITDLGRTTKFENQTVVDLPDYSSPNAMVTLTDGEDCSLTKRIGDDAGYLKSKQSCASGAALPAPGSEIPVLYPNPSRGVFTCLQNGSVRAMDEITVIDPQGGKVANYRAAKQVDLTAAPAGIYIYKMVINGAVFTGKLVKL